jgi:hypothetical protein
MGNPLPPQTFRMTDTRADLADYVRSALPGIQALYFGGGEPLLEESHYELLETLLELGRDDVVLDYNSNLTVLKCGSREILPLWRRFRTVKVAASFDGVGGQFEYLRKGASWAKVLENHRRITREAPDVFVFLAPTVGAMNVFHLPVAIEEWLRSDLLKWPDQLFLNYIRRPEYLAIGILNGDERRRLAISYESFLARIPATVHLALRKSITRSLRNVLGTLDRQAFTEEQARLRLRFREVTGQVDRLREEKFEALFPELAGLMT